MLYILLIYFIFLAAYLIYSAVAIYHLWRFGYVGDLTKPAIIYNNDCLVPWFSKLP